MAFKVGEDRGGQIAKQMVAINFYISYQTMLVFLSLTMFGL